MKTNIRTDICLSLGVIDFQKILTLVTRYPLVELRLDALTLSKEELRQIFATGKKIIATCRSNYPDEVEQQLMTCIDLGCWAIDVDFSLPESLQTQLYRKASVAGCKVIASFHHFDATPSEQELKAIYHQMLNKNPTYLKIVTMAHSRDDVLKILTLYTFTPAPIAFCMGDIGKVSRLMAPILGAPFTYAAFKDKATAPGQLPYPTVAAFLDEYLRG